MKNRFSQGKRPRRRGWTSLLLPGLLFLLVAGLFVAGLDGIDRTTQKEQLASAQRAVTRACVQCYALEGRYPPDIDYLEENYGLSVDREKYIVHYDVFASNVMPQITVLPMDFGGKDDVV